MRNWGKFADNAASSGPIAGASPSAAGIATTVGDDGSLRTERDPAEVGRAAYDGGVVLTELRTADSGGLEEMFLELTADTQRERTAA